MKSSDFIFDFVDVFYCKCRKINLNCGGPFIDYSEWIKNGKATINPVNHNDKCYQYNSKVALNHEETGKNLQRISVFTLRK